MQTALMPMPMDIQAPVQTQTQPARSADSQAGAKGKDSFGDVLASKVKEQQPPKKESASETPRDPEAKAQGKEADRPDTTNHDGVNPHGKPVGKPEKEEQPGEDQGQNQNQPTIVHFNLHISLMMPVAPVQAAQTTAGTAAASGVTQVGAVQAAAGTAQTAQAAQAGTTMVQQTAQTADSQIPAEVAKTLEMLTSGQPGEAAKDAKAQPAVETQVGSPQNLQTVMVPGGVKVAETTPTQQPKTEPQNEQAQNAQTGEALVKSGVSGTQNGEVHGANKGEAAKVNQLVGDKPETQAVTVADSTGTLPQNGQSAGNNAGDGQKPGQSEPKVASVKTEAKEEVAEQTGQTQSNQTTTFAQALNSLTNQTGAKTASFESVSPQPTARAQDPNDIMGQIVDQAKLINRPQNTEMIIKLKPEHLGELTMKVTVESGTIRATFHSDNPEVRAAIEATLPQLKQEMTNQGIKVHHVGVYTALDQFFSGQQQNQNQQFAKQTGRMKTMRIFEDSVEALAPTGTTGAAGGVDYRI